MIRLPEVYKCKGQKGFTYKILKREGKVVLSEMFADYDDDSHRGYEVFVVQEYPERMSPDGKTKIEAREACPPSTSWGVKGHSYSSGERGLKLAEARFWEMCRIHNDLIGATRKKNGQIKKAQPAHITDAIFHNPEYQAYLKQKENEKN